MTRRVLDEIRRLDIPAKCKADLALLCAKAKRLGLRILRFIRSHRQFAEAMLLGAVAAYRNTRPTLPIPKRSCA